MPTPALAVPILLLSSATTAMASAMAILGQVKKYTYGRSKDSVCMPRGKIKSLLDDESVIIHESALLIPETLIVALCFCVIVTHRKQDRCHASISCCHPSSCSQLQAGQTTINGRHISSASFSVLPAMQYHHD